LFALRAVSLYFVFEEFNRISAMGAFDIENCIKAPVLSIISGAFSHGYIYHLYHELSQVLPVSRILRVALIAANFKVDS
jgi:hypothetical protein